MISDGEYRYFASDQKVAIVTADETPVTLTMGDGREVHMKLSDLFDDAFADMDHCVLSFNTHEIEEVDCNPEGDNGE